MERYRVYGALMPDESERERNHKRLAREAAAEGFVLLKNEGVLPLTSKKIALYGPGSRKTVKGGSGSGDVRERHSVTIEEGLLNAGFKFATTLWMERFEEKYNRDIENWKAAVDKVIKGYSPIHTMDMFIKIGEMPKPNPSCTPVMEDELTTVTDTAVYVLSRQAGEGKDRRLEKGDYLLSDIEKESLRLLSEHYKKLVLVLNCGGAVDLSILDEIRIDAVLFYAQGGMEGGNALADILTGKKTPCGKLTDTWAYHYKDFPFADSYSYLNGNVDKEEYREGIYVGYRYFSTFGIRPRFPFGYGLSYTDFSIRVKKIKLQVPKVTVEACVYNTGNTYGGKEIPQLYLSKPQTGMDVEKISLAAFVKTNVISPGENEQVSLSFDMREQAVYDESRNCFVLPQGKYGLFLGNSSETASLVSTIEILEEAVVEYVSHICKKQQGFDDLQSKNEIQLSVADVPGFVVDTSEITPIVHAEKMKQESSFVVSELLKKLKKRDKIRLVVGGGYAIRCFNNVMGAAGRTCTTLLKKGIPNIVLADGPAGINVTQYTAVAKDGFPRYPEGLPEEWKWGWLRKFEAFIMRMPGKARPVYRYMTAWPSATLLAQSWNEKLLGKVGEAVGKEMLETGVSVWLAPGLNIHRNPLCGRNFEYYSEDPLVSGKMAAAVTRGVQGCGGVGVCIKHFCCNNQEENRTGVSENVSARALREIYLKAFRIVVQEGKPWTVMSSYNKVNGRYVCNSRELLTGVLREEWGYEGLVMSDWNATEQCSYTEAINAGNDLIMPGTKSVARNLAKDPLLEPDALEQSAQRVLEIVFKSDSCKDI